jgi:DNA-binding GntR family transcriptional regulator
MSNDEIIYNKLLKAIVEHQLPPGSRLPEDRLSEAFNVSRTGIRKVLQRLAIERFVLIQPNKGAQVNKPGAKEANEVFDSRILLEPQLVPALKDLWDSKQSERFRIMVDQEKQAELNDDLAASIQLTAKFHYELAQVAGNEILANFVEQLCYRSSLVVAAYGSKNSVGCDCGEHSDFITILDSGDFERAQKWMRHHLEQIKLSLKIESKKSEEIDFHNLFSN